VAYRDTSIVIPVAIDEDPKAVQALVSMILLDGSVTEIRVVTQGPGIDFPLSMNEKVIVRQQSDPRAKKASALNDGLFAARGSYVLFIDGDVVLKGDEIGIAREALEDADFVSAAYGSRAPAFPIVAIFGGWFCGARTNVFRDIGGFAADYVEDVKTTTRIKQAGFKITMLPFAVQVRRAPRRPLTKLLSSMFAGR